MENQLSSAATTALSPLLSCFHEVQGCPLKAVWEAIVYDEIDSIQLDFGMRVLSIGVDGDDDTIRMEIATTRTPNTKDASHLRPWSQEIGKPFGWGWLSINQQGYLDSVSLAFGAVTPKLTVTALGSSLRITKNYSTRKRDDVGFHKQKQEGLDERSPTSLSAGAPLHH